MVSSSSCSEVYAKTTLAFSRVDSCGGGIGGGLLGIAADFLNSGFFGCSLSFAGGGG